MCVRGQPLPRRLEGEQALRPRTEQQGVVVSVLALGEADGQSIDGPELRLDAVEPTAHGDLHRGCSSRNESATVPSVGRSPLRSNPPMDSPRGQSAGRTRSSWLREVTWSFINTLLRWYLTVRGLMNS